VGTNERKRAIEAAAEADRPRRRWGRALLWIALVAALAVAALAVSFSAEESRDATAEPPFDTAVFCLTAARFGEFRELDLDTGAGTEQLRGLQTVAQQLATLSPAPIADDLDAVRQALQNVEGVVQAIPADDPDAIGIVTTALDEELALVAEQADEVASYVERWCGPPPDTTPTSSMPE
jgi:hypothetical protein